MVLGVLHTPAHTHTLAGMKNTLMEEGLERSKTENVRTEMAKKD